MFLPRDIKGRINDHSTFATRALLKNSLLGFNSTYKVITSFSTKEVGLDDFTAWCSWANPSETVIWVAVWRFEDSNVFTNLGSISRTVDIDTAIPSGYAAVPYQVNFNQSTPALQTRGYSVTRQPNVPSSGKTRITITDNDTGDIHQVVDENPVFIRFAQP